MLRAMFDYLAERIARAQSFAATGGRVLDRKDHRATVRSERRR